MANHSALRSHAQVILRQMMLVLILSGVIGLSVNAIRYSGISVIGDWSTKGRLLSGDGSSLVISIIEAKAAFNKKQALFLNTKVLVNGWTVWQEINLPVEGGFIKN